MGRKITFEEVEKWREMRSRGYSYKAVADHFCTSTKTVARYLKLPHSPSSDDNQNGNLPTCNSTQIQASQTDLESDPDVLRLKKELELAKLRKQIREEELPFELETKMEELKEQLLEQEHQLSEILEWIKSTNQWIAWINGTLAIQIQRVKCERCGTQGKIGIHIKCTKCEHVSLWGFFDEE